MMVGRLRPVIPATPTTLSRTSRPLPSRHRGSSRRSPRPSASPTSSIPAFRATRWPAYGLRGAADGFRPGLDGCPRLARRRRKGFRGLPSLSVRADALPEIETFSPMEANAAYATGSTMRPAFAPSSRRCTDDPVADPLVEPRGGPRSGTVPAATMSPFSATQTGRLEARRW